MKTILMTLAALTIVGTASAHNASRCLSDVFKQSYATAEAAESACRANWPTCLVYRDFVVYDVVFKNYRLDCDTSATD